MAEYSLSDSKGFIVKRSEVDGRLDPYYNYYLKNIQLKSIFEEESLYKISKPFSGGTPSKNNPEYWEGDIPWVSPKDFKGLYLDESEDHISEKGLQNSSTKLVPAYSVLIVVRSGILIHSLPVTINTVPVTINQDLKAFVINDDRILPEYLGIYFYVFGRKLLPLITKHSTTVQSINTEQFAKLKIPIPDKPIQQRIIALLNTALSNKQQKEKEARDLLDGIDDYLLKTLGITLPQRQSDLQSRIFTTSFSEVTGNRFDVFAVLNKDYRIEGGAYENLLLRQVANLVKGQSITSDKIISGNIPVIAGGQTSPYSHNDFNFEGTVITVSASGAYSGYVWYHPSPIFASDCTVIKSKDEDKISTLFLSEILKLKQKEIYNLQQGAGQPHVYPSDLAKLNIPVPPPNKQKEFVQHIQSIRIKADEMQTKATTFFEEAKAEIEKLILG